MNDTKMTTGLTQTWVRVTDVRGRIRLEARWTPITPDDAPVHAPRTIHAA